MAKTWVSASAQVKALAKAVSTAFAASVLTEEEKNPGKIEIMDLPWQAPPLIMSAELNGVPLCDYIDTPIAMEEDTVASFWMRTLADMHDQPARLMRNGALSNCGWAMPDVRPGQRALRFTKPAGYPQPDEMSGVIFSLEVAHAASISLPILELVSDDDNYYAVLPDRSIVGVENGRPACNSSWSGDASGMVPDLLTMVRGDVDYHCRFDQIASLRSILHVHRARFPRNFEGLDLALQALRLLSMGTWCPDLVQQMYVAPMDMGLLRQQEYAWRDAIEVIPTNMSDRSKLQVMYNVLVPAAITVGAFKKNIFAGSQFPFTLAAGKMQQIETWLRQEYETRIPADMRQLKE